MKKFLVEIGYEENRLAKTAEQVIEWKTEDGLDVIEAETAEDAAMLVSYTDGLENALFRVYELSENDFGEIEKVGKAEYFDFIVEKEEVKIKELKNEYDYEICFTDLEQAKHYYMPKDELHEEGYTGDFEEDSKLYDEYKKEIANAESLDELADVLNRYTDIFYDGTMYKVVEYSIFI